jgi:MFS family permease
VSVPSAANTRWRIAALFFVHAFASGAIHTRIPDIQIQLGLSEAGLGLALIGQPVGALITFIFSSRIIEAVGPRRVSLFLLPILAVTPALVPTFGSPAAMFVLMALNGVSFSLTNIAMNVEADRIEAASGRRIMNTCHGAWSLGFLATALMGALARGVDISTLVHLWAIAPLVLIVLMLVVIPMHSAPERAHAGTASGRRLSLPTVATMALVAYGLGAGLLEGATRTWSIIYMRDSFTVPAWLESMTLPAMLVAMASCRLLADGWIDRFGPVRVAVSLGLVAMAGLGLVVVAPRYELALAGFSLIGVGICVAFPLMTSAAARLGDRPASQNVAATTLVIQLANLGAPALLGWVAQAYGVRTTFALLLPLLALSLLMARRLAPAPPAYSS